MNYAHKCVLDPSEEAENMSRLLKSCIHSIRRRRTHYTPLVSVKISERALRNNYSAFRRAFSTLGIAPVLKSNAYGHGLVEVARVFDNDGIPFFCIDTYAEALILRNNGIKTPLLILGYSLPENIRENRCRTVAFTIASIDALEQSAALGVPFECHIKIDTGMHRQGVLPEEIPKVFDILSRAPQIRVTGIMSHLADADGNDETFTRTQINTWNAAADQLKKQLPSVRFIHCAATEGSTYTDSITANILRLGIGLYGCSSTPSVVVEPVLELVSLVSAVRTVRIGEKIGYNATYTAPRDMIIATVPVGYAEGVDRRLSNVGGMLVHGKPCAIVGRVSMNMTTLDVTDVDSVHSGDEVIVISRNRKDVNSCENIAAHCGTIPYEILVHIPQLLRRVFV